MWYFDVRFEQAKIVKSLDNMIELLLFLRLAEIFVIADFFKAFWPNLLLQVRPFLVCQQMADFFNPGAFSDGLFA